MPVAADDDVDILGWIDVPKRIRQFPVSKINELLV